MIGVRGWLIHFFWRDFRMKPPESTSATRMSAE